MRASCPSCDAPVAVSARTCASCGYPLLEDEARPRRERAGGRADGRPSLLPFAVGAAALAGVLVAVALLAGGGGEPGPDGSAEPDARTADRPSLEILSQHPLSGREMERLLAERFGELPDGDAHVSCSGLVAKPAHAVRRCRLLYPHGLERLVILLTDARGRERLAGLR